MRVIFRCDPALADVLPRPVPARSVLPDWLRIMPRKAFSEIHGREIRTVKQCPPFIDAMTHGFVILLPCDVTVRNTAFEWDWAVPGPSTIGHPRAPLSFHVPEQLEGTPLANGLAAVKFNSFWTVELEPGWSLFVTHPINRLDLPFRLVTGVVDSDRFYDAGINFPAVWTDHDFNGVLPKGTPIAQCFPVRRAPPELIFECLDNQHAAAYAKIAADVIAGPGVYRKRYRVKRTDLSTE